MLSLQRSGAMTARRPDRGTLSRAGDRHVIHRPFAWRAAAASVIVLVTALVAHRGLPAWEEDVFEWTQSLPDWLKPIVWAPMQLGSVLAPLVVAVGAWIAWRRWRPAVGALVVGVAGWWLAKGIKDLVGRGRPYAEMVGHRVRAGAPTDGLGFLSGHATVAFGLATVLSPYLKPIPRVIAYGVAALVAFSRVYVGAHFPLDVVAGAAFGCLLGWLWHLAVGVPESVLRITEPALVEGDA
jgi:glycosyltransferase 2 family protein